MPLAPDVPTAVHAPVGIFDSGLGGLSVLRHVRRRPAEPFGGVQKIFIGDLFQLPPVVKAEEWALLHESYSSTNY